MIRFQELVPDYYPEKSRDFQVLCRLYDYPLNSLMFNIDSMQSITDTRKAKDTILPLIGDKFGIYDKQSYSNRHLLAALPIALKYKGSLKAVSILVNAFLDSMEIFDYATAFEVKDDTSSVEVSSILGRDIKPYTIVIVLSAFPNMTNLHVLNEYINMVIPTGMIVEYMFGTNYEILEQFKYKEYVFLFFTNKTVMEDTISKYQDVSLVKNKLDRYVGQVPSEYSGNEFIEKVVGNVDVNSVSIASISGKPTEE